MSLSSPISDVLQPFVDRGEASGFVTAVANRDGLLALDTVGFSDIASGKAMAADSLFWIASQTKPITGTVVMMLVEEGLIDLDDPIEKYLPEFKGVMVVAEQDEAHRLLVAPAHPPTVREALAHTSGMPFSTVVERPTLDRLPLDAAVRSYSMAPLNFQPGTKWSYSNAGINTAARVLEVVSGEKYEDFLDRRLLKPLGLKDTSFWPTEADLGRIATTYGAVEGGALEPKPTPQLIHPVSSPGRYPMPAGGLYSSGPDVARFCQMILRGGELNGVRYLKEESVREMTSRQTAPGIENNYGLGWATWEGGAGHGGAVSTGMQIYFEAGLVTVFLVQMSPFGGLGGTSQDAFKKAALDLFGGGDSGGAANRVGTGAPIRA